MLSHLAGDLRYGVRSLRRTPLFACGAIATLALAIGANAAIFSVVHGVLLRQLPFKEPERLLWIWSDQPGRDRTPFNVPDFADYRDRNRTLQALAGYFAFGANLSDLESAERVQGAQATTNLFEALGIEPELGRLLRSDDERAGREHVVVLAHALWQRRFGGDARIIGQSIRLNGESYLVIGVLPPRFVTPIRDVEFVVPFVVDADLRRHARNSVNFIHGVGRLRGDASRAQAEDDLTTIARRLQQEYPVENARKRGVHVESSLEGIAGSFQTALFAIFAAVGSVLLIACANLANLTLSRATSRRKEIAVRLALGSPRRRLVQQVLMETVLLGATGGALGLLLARFGVDALLMLAPSDLPRTGDIRIDATVLTYSAAISMLTGLLFGVIPAFTSASVDVNHELRAGGRGATPGGSVLRGAFIACEVALAFVLLIVAGLFGKSFANVQAVTPGFEPARVLSVRIALPARRYNSRDAIVRFQAALQQRLSAVPAITHAGAISLLPLSGLLSRVPFTVEGQPIARERIPAAQFRFVSAGYFETMHIRLLQGRTFSERDSDRTGPVAIVSEALAAQWLTAGRFIGARLLIDDNDGPPRPVDVVGVVESVRQQTLDSGPSWDLYLPYTQIHADNVGAAAGNMFWVLGTSADPMTVAAPFTRELRRVDPEVAAAQIRPLESYLANSLAPRRFSLLLLSIFGAAALALAVTGIYAVISYGASQRAREIAIRMALGARGIDIQRLVMRQGLQSTIAGLLCGLPLAFGASRLISTMLFGLSPTDAVTFLEVMATIVAVAAIACAVPAFRAARAGTAALSEE
jgi:putative ABC transport system permease protein